MHIRLLTCILLVIPSAAAAATSKQIQQAVDKAKAYLYEQQKEDHTWEYGFDGHGGQVTGQTALAVYALLSAQESPHDPRLAAAIDYLQKTPTTGVYALGLRCQIWLMLPPTPQVRGAMHRDGNVLIRGVKRGAGEANGFYDYNAGAGGTTYSHSRAQYGVLGVWAAEQMGIPVPRSYWQLVEKAWIDHQDPSGGWNYIAKQDRWPITPGMTAVGVATLFITQDYLHAAEGLNCRGNISNPSIDRGMKWLSDNFDKVATDEKYKRDLPYSTLYAIERVGVASGYKYFNGIDWYQKGADWLVKKQRSDGSFPSEFSGIKHYTTGLALLFLIRGSSPLLMNKLDYSFDADSQPTEQNAKPSRGVRPDPDDLHWNQRPRDVANIARWTGRQIERELNWQIVGLDAPVEDFHDAPILYLAGNQKIELGEEHETKIKLFVEQGGLVLAHADCSSDNFVQGIKAMASRIFPYELQPLPENHVIYTNQQFPRSRWTTKPAVMSISNGARELLMLLPDGDPARTWQQQQTTGSREEQFQLAANIFLYAVDKKNLRRRGESYLVERNQRIKPTRTLHVAHLQYSGNWDPEPGGWRRLASVMHNEYATTLEVQPVKLGGAQLAPFKVAHLTGTMSFKLDADQQGELKKFVQEGGTLIIDAAGGSTAFAISAEAELAAISSSDAQTQLSKVLPPEHAIFQKDGKPIEIDYRTFARSKLGNIRSAQLRGVTVGDRLSVVFSREDLSVGLVGQPVDGIVGYSPETATRLMANLLEWSAANAK